MFGTGLTGRLSLALSFLYFINIYGEPVIQLYPGQISGTTITTRNGRNISAFLGIPYAKPPVGSRRFRPAEMTTIFSIWDNTNMTANVDGNRCPQLNDDGVVVGDEDCLYLNVYTPDISPDELIPTMVYFHGGNFVRGSGSSTDAGPEYLLDKDIVLVTVNYRLGVLGFLSTGDDAAPGNFGLKDQVVALQWIRTHIVAFGGAVVPMTIFGQGAGGVCTSLLAISDQSKDLFHRYISQSGNLMSLWGHQDEMNNNYYQRARDLGKHLKCPTGKSADLVDCLRKVDVNRLVDSNAIFRNLANTPWLTTTWAPTEEPKGRDAFLSEFPYNKALKDGIKDCPAILGNVRDEGLIVTAGFYADDKMYDKVAANLTAFMRETLTRFFSPNPDKNPNNLIQDYYFEGISPTDDKELFIRNLTQLATDMEFRFPSEIQTRLISQKNKNPLYHYTFDYRGTFSKTSATIGNNDNLGITHGDELLYLFPMKNADFELSESDQKMIDVMIDFWTTFARTGTPTSQYAADPNVWKPYEFNTSMSLHIGDNGDPTNMQLRLEYDKNLKLWDVANVKSLEAFVSVG